MEANRGKLLVYASSAASCRRRLKSVSEAAGKTAKKLNLDVEIITRTETKNQFRFTVIKIRNPAWKMFATF